MGQFNATSAAALLLATVVLSSACSNGGIGITTGSAAVPPAGATTAAAAADPMARSVQVASISACAQKWGMAFDPADLRARYLAYEAKQPGVAGAQLTNIQQSYDAAWKTASANAETNARLCAGKDAGEVTADLRRYRSGYFAPRANVAGSDGALDPSKFFKEVDDN
jgi:hypothetical protein